MLSVYLILSIALLVAIAPASTEGKCEKGYKLDKKTKECKDVCQFKNPCQNEGICKVTNPANRKFTCECPEGVLGKLCKCADTVCQNKNGPNAECGLTGSGSGKCQCKKGYKLDKKTKICKDPCEILEPCENGGKCVVKDPSEEDPRRWRCECPENVYGGKCECDAAECNAKQPNTECTKSVQWWAKPSTCTCKKGFPLNKKTKTCDACGPLEAMEYCELSCENTMCVYPGPNPECQIVESGGVNITAADKQAVLDIHNEYRQKVASGNEPGMPAATKPMPDLEWDNDLAVVALRWASQCEWAHDIDRSTPQWPKQVGQNMYVWSHKDPPAKAPSTRLVASVKAYYGELEYFLAAGCTPDVYSKTCKNGQTKDFGMVGHFTQVIWQKSTHVGCAYVWFQVPDDPKKKYNKIYTACNYAPGGNYRGATIYE